MHINADHQIKVNRAVKLSAIGSHPGSAPAMLGAIPADVIATLPARLIAARDAIAEWMIWDAAQGRHRDIAA